MNYQSTRGYSNQEKFSDVILQGQAPDGGLFVPEKIPHVRLDELLELHSYQDVAMWVCKAFEVDFDEDDLEEILDAAYNNGTFPHEQVAPVAHIHNNIFALEQWHGPTVAFKDFALQMLPQCFSKAIEKKMGEKQDPSAGSGSVDKNSGHIDINYLILVATSGDTGKAALEGFKDAPHVKIAAFYPEGGVSEIQALQMNTTQGDNTRVISVQGDFDDIQTKGVKELFNDEAFKQELLEEHNTVLSSANSINFGRILPQIIYYFWSYIQMSRSEALRFGNPFDVCIPSGNFGNMLAAYYAFEMGLPIDRFVVASNQNNVLTDFITSGVYDVWERELFKTNAPSMDILVSSNIERFLYHLSGENEAEISQYMKDLKTNQYFAVSDRTKGFFESRMYAGFADDESTLRTIKHVATDYNYLMDPHTAIGYNVAMSYIDKMKSTKPLLIASTAGWTKFASSVYTALADDEPLADWDEFETLKAVQQEFKSAEIPDTILGLQGLPITQDHCIEKGTTTMKEAIRSFLKK